MGTPVRFNRRMLMLGGVMLPVMSPAIVRAQSRTTLKYATNVTLDNPLNIRLLQAFERIKGGTNGAIEFKLFPNGQLGSDPAVLGQLRNGGVEFFAMSTVLLSSLAPLAAVPGLGFAFPDYDTLWKAMDGDLGELIRQDIAKTGIIGMERITDTGFRQMTTSGTPIKTPADLVGRKMRIPASPLWTSMFEAFGSSPAAINWNETYTSLQTKIVDGAELPLSSIYTGKLFEVQKTLSLTRHMWDGWWQLANQRVWNKLPSEARDVISRHLNQASVEIRADMVKFEDVILSDLKTRGMEILEVDRTLFREKLKATGFYTAWKSRFGEQVWTSLEKYVGKIE